MCVCVCVCVIMKHVFDNFWWFKKCPSFFFRLSIWPLSTCYGEVVTYCCGFDFFFETPFLSPIMISMQANQRERTSWLLYFLSFFVDPARPLLTYPTCKTNGNLCLCTNNNTIAPPNMTTHHSWQIVSSIRGHVAQGFEFGGALGRVTHHTIASW